MGTAAGAAVAGLAAALGWPPWPPAPLLIAALLLALVTLVFALLARRLRRISTSGAAGTILALGGLDATLLVVGAGLAPSPGPSVLFLLLFGASALLHGTALARAVAGRGVDASVPLLGATSRAREAIGIVRARADALRLAAEDAGVAAPLEHDLDVLVHQAEECQRELRRLEQAIDAASPGSSRSPSRGDGMLVQDQEGMRGSDDAGSSNPRRKERAFPTK